MDFFSVIFRVLFEYIIFGFIFVLIRILTFNKYPTDDFNTTFENYYLWYSSYAILAVIAIIYLLAQI